MLNCKELNSLKVNLTKKHLTQGRENKKTNGAILQRCTVLNQFLKQ
jgi:hypothetical protein